MCKRTLPIFFSSKDETKYVASKSKFKTDIPHSFFIASLAAVVINLPFQSALAKIYIQMQLKVKFNEMKQSNLSACLCFQVY